MRIWLFPQLPLTTLAADDGALALSGYPYAPDADLAPDMEWTLAIDLRVFERPTLLAVSLPRPRRMG